MKTNKKIISILFITLLLFERCEQHLLKSVRNLSGDQAELIKINNKILTNENDVFISNENQNVVNRLLAEKQVKPFFFLLIGSKNLRILKDILSPLGEKWKGKILETVNLIFLLILQSFKLDRLPPKIDNSFYRNLKNSDIPTNSKEFRKQKEILTRKMKEFDGEFANLEKAQVYFLNLFFKR